MKEFPLVSVVIVTYNSSSTIVETLDSVNEQSYENIELIVSDDHSSDDTIHVCKEWMKSHRKRFVNCEVITSDHNTGVTANVNRGWKATHGEWVKILGGDDLFLPHAVSDVVKFITPQKDIVVTQYNTFMVNNVGVKVLGELHPVSTLKPFYDEDDAEARKKMIIHTFIEATIGYFIRRSVLEKVGGYDEDYPMIEDAPMFLKLTFEGYKFCLLEKPCFLYRINESIMHPPKDIVYNIRFKESSLRFHRRVLNKQRPWWDFVYHQSFWLGYIQYYLIVKLAHNRKNKLSHFIKTVVYYLTIENYIKK